MKKLRGFFFTASVISVVSFMLFAAFLYQQAKFDPSPLLLAEKVTYSWEDIAEDLSKADGFNATKSGNTLSVVMDLPSSKNISQELSTYANFTQSFYAGPDTSIGFYSADGQQITDFSCFGKKNCNDNTVQFHILPFNMTYSFPDLTKKQLDIVCYDHVKDGFPVCDSTHIRALNISINLTAMNFTCNPSIYNNCTQNDIEWDTDFDEVFGCTSGTGCINYSLMIRDNNSKTYNCQGVYGANNGNTKRVNCDATTFNWLENDETVLTIKSSPCQVRLRFGNEGRFRVESTAPASENCNINLTLQSMFVFDTTNFWTDFSTQLLVRDNLANYSIKTQVQ